MSERAADRRSPRFFRRITDSARFKFALPFFFFFPLWLSFSIFFFCIGILSSTRHPAGAQGKSVRTPASCYRFGPGRPRLLPSSGPVGAGGRVIERERGMEKRSSSHLCLVTGRSRGRGGRTLLSISLSLSLRPARVHACMSLRCRPPPRWPASLPAYGVTGSVNQAGGSGSYPIPVLISHD